MPNGVTPVLTGAVEGDLDEAVLDRIVHYSGLTLGNVHGRRGKHFLLQSLNGYNSAARFLPWVVLIDLDQDCDCAPPCVEDWLPQPSPRMFLRVAVRAIESWILGDTERIAEFLRIRVAWVPRNPDELDNPKRDLVNLARRSRRNAIREDFVPREGSGRSVGPLYTSRLIEFVRDEDHGWRPDHAIHASDSLARCVNHLRQFAEAHLRR